MDATKTPPPETPEDDEDSLDAPETDVVSTSERPTDPNTIDATSSSPLSGTIQAASATKLGFKDKLRRFNLYLIIFLFIMVLAGAICAIAYFQSKQASTTSTLKTQALTQQTLQQVANSDATIGNAQQVLNVESSAVFAGKVLIRDGLEVAGALRIGGTVAVNDITVSGSASLGQVQVSKNFAVAGDSALQGSVTVAKSLQVNGSGTFSGPVSAPQITTSNFQLNGDLVLTHHITTGGGTPGRNNGPALGSGGSATVGGSDTGGTVTINTGSAPVAGCFITVTFTSKYSATPHILLTPVGSAGGVLDYYVNRDSGSFSICDATPPPAGSSFGFDYFVVD